MIPGSAVNIRVPGSHLASFLSVTDDASLLIMAAVF